MQQKYLPLETKKSISAAISIPLLCLLLHKADDSSIGQKENREGPVTVLLGNISDLMCLFVLRSISCSQNVLQPYRFRFAG